MYVQYSTIQYYTVRGEFIASTMSTPECVEYSLNYFPTVKESARRAKSSKLVDLGFCLKRDLNP